ncbi:T9SS type A sorting domain-containing protein [Aureispira sp. CCB-E]|uniref:DUF7619 domain-containing protein n=1 Tax=Aureispira sp. CCB-E TaxID=3051121 RepID=UPI0028687918|nr:T9SS type A sorting domain-containing protein [Aureispira sp. CCB-E]WMX13745.1 T9SS type A sorting domain-containing protein [Aureispira sp. CCB-E]
MRYLSFLVLLCLGIQIQAQQMVGNGITCAPADIDTSSVCVNMLQICGNATFPLSTNGALAPQGNNYNCLATQPNPTWFFMQVQNSGSILLELSNSANVDIDFILWGPFNNISDATNACGNLGNNSNILGNVVDTCSYSAVGLEFISISNATAGSIYVLMITNFSNQPTNGSLTQLSGTGSLVCSLTAGDGFISGTVYDDLDNNCVQDSLENGLAGRLVRLHPSNLITTTNALGEYAFCGLPVDSYTVEILMDTFYWNSCPNTGLRTAQIIATNDTITQQDFGMSINNACYDLYTDVVSTNLRPCFSTNVISAYYRNNHESNMTADSVEVTITLDTALFPITSNIPWTSAVGNQYTFYVGNLSPGQYGTINMTCSLSCATPVGATLCIQSEISPIDSCSIFRSQDSIVVTPPCANVWDRSSLMVTGNCINDSLACFTIYNTGQYGTGDMLCYRPVRMYIDSAIYLLDSVMLTGGDSLEYCFPANGHTLRLEVDQHPMHPGNSHPNAVVELCGDSAAIAANWTPGLVNQFPHDDANSNIDIDCIQTSASFDPNDKRGFPLGRTEAHLIGSNTDLEYIIRFQNTGNDTAFTVIIQDILPPELDILSIEHGASSHAYTFQINQSNTLEWHFHNILLPDSTTNLEGSKGFVSFKVKQQPNLPDGTFIHNKASIYFDFNPPIITNLSEHLIDNSIMWVITSTDPIEEETVANWKVDVFPNPVQQIVYLKSELRIERINLMSLEGRLIQQTQPKQMQTSLNLSTFPQGIYFLEIHTPKGIVTKRIMKLK